MPTHCTDSNYSLVTQPICKRQDSNTFEFPKSRRLGPPGHCLRGIYSTCPQPRVLTVRAESKEVQSGSSSTWQTLRSTAPTKCRVKTVALKGRVQKRQQGHVDDQTLSHGYPLASPSGNKQRNGMLYTPKVTSRGSMPGLEPDDTL